MKSQLNGARSALIAGIAVCLLFSGCGGGGGTGNTGGGGANANDPAPGFSVSIDRTELRFEGDEGASIASQAVLGSSTGTTTATIYTGALDLGTSIDHVTQQVVGTQLKFTAYPKANLPAGEYQGTLQLFACADDKCARHFTGSPANVPYTIVVRKGLTVSPKSLPLSAVSGAALVNDLAVQLPSGVTSFSVSTSTAWMSTEQPGANIVRLTTKPMPPGNYSGVVSISIPGRSIDVPVNYTVLADANTRTQFASDVNNFSFTATAGGVAGSRAVKVTLPSWTTELSGEIVYGGVNKGWLTLSKSDDTSFTLVANATDLGAGAYTAQLVLRSGYLTSPLTLPITLSVGAATWAISGNTSFTVDATTNDATLTSALQINLPNLPAQGWSASSGASWLKLVNTSGTTGSTKLQVALDMPAMLKLPNAASYQADVTISSASGKVAPIKVGFTLAKNLPQVNYGSPHLRLPNESGPLILRGHGFDSLPDLRQALKVSGAQVDNIVRVNDTQLLLQVAGTVSGSATFNIGNALGVSTGTATLKVVAPTSYAYKAVATAGVKGGFIYDDERQSAYTVNKTLGSIMRFAYADGAWTVQAAALPTAESVVMSPDGASLVATASNGKIVLFDPLTLAQQGSYPVPVGVLRNNTYYPGGSIYGNNLSPIPSLVMANNGKAFFEGSGGNPEGGLAFFDVSSQQYGGIALPNLNFYAPSGPNLGMSGDGSRLLFGYQSNDDRNNMLYLDTADQLVKPNGAGIVYWSNSAQSLHGERSTDMYRVWDKSFSLVGMITLPNNYFPRTAVFSPDGARLYALAYYSGLQRVYVLDTSTKLVTTTDLPILGYIDLAVAPTCNAADDTGCAGWPQGAISADGATLFFIGEAKFVVVPIPAALKPASARAPMQRAKPGAGTVPDVLVPLKLIQH